jgi:hypothetical protein
MNLPSDVTLYAFDVLKDFVGLYEYVQRDSKVRIFNIPYVIYKFTKYQLLL